MFCKKCGNKIEENALFCTKCGTSVKQEPVEIEKSGGGKKVAKIVAIVVAVCVIATGAITGGLFLKEQQVLKNRTKYVAELGAWITEIEKEQEKYILSEEQKEEFEDSIQELEYAIEDETVETKVLEKNKKEIEEFVKNLEEENKAQIVDLQETLEKADLSNGLESDLTAAEEYRKAIESKLAEGDYKEAWNSLQEWQELVDLVNNPIDNYNVSVKQYDLSEYPNIKIYLDVTDEAGNFVPKLNKSAFYLNEQRNVEGEMKRQTIVNVSQLNENEGISIALVADISGSMGDLLPEAQRGMKNFINTVQFQKGDEIELTQFSDRAYICNSFTNDATQLNNAINQMYADGGTRLYDTLISEIERVHSRQNAKCVIGFTDGYDNESYYTYQDAINSACNYQIPVFLIGIGSECDEMTLRQIAEKTGGIYTNIADITSLEEIYNQIYKQEKEVYLLEYEVTAPDDFESPCNLDIYVRTEDKNGGFVKNFSFEPKDFFNVMYNRFLVAGIDCQTKGERNLLDSGLIITTEEAYQNENCVAYQSQEAINNGGVGSKQSNVFEVLVAYDVLNVYKEGDGYVVYGVSNYDISKIKKYSSSNDMEKAKMIEYYGDNISEDTMFRVESNISNYEKLTLIKDTDGKWKFNTRVYEREDGSKPYFVNQVYTVEMQ